ncbi:MAG: hypothetical protein ABI717_02065 [Actinomycetota bacterium]
MTTTTENCWGTAYWLRNCEGFRVETEDGEQGYVDAVELTPGGEAAALVVRFGERFTHAVRVPVRAVEELDATSELITLGPLSGARGPAYRQLRIPAAISGREGAPTDS